MARTFIGTDLDDGLLRLVALEEDGNQLKPVALVQREVPADESSADIIAAILAEWDTSNSRIAAALPASIILTRSLEFPFGEKKKISAAIPLELRARLPIDLDGHLVTSLDPRLTEDRSHRTIGLAVPKEEIARFLSPFDALRLPLRQLGAEPFVYADGIGDLPADVMLVSARAHEISILLLLQGEPEGHQTRIRKSSESASETAAQLCRDLNVLQRRAGRHDLPVRMFGAGLDADIQRAVVAEFPQASVPEEFFEGERLAPEFIPALALARLAAKPGKSCNLRQGEFAFRGSLAPFKKQLVAIAILLSVGLFAMVGGAWMSYSDKSAVLRNLDNRMQDIYRQTFPRADEIPKDVLLHMTSRLNEARNRSNLVGAPGAGPLPILEAISKALPENSPTIIEELNYDATGIRLVGKTTSFDAVDQLAASLNQSPLFSQARISQAKTNIDGKQIEFRIDLGFAGEGGAQ